MSNSKSENKSENVDLERRELTAEELENVIGGFNPQPEPPASGYSSTAPKINPGSMRGPRIRGF